MHKPKLAPEIWADLQALDVGSVRALLAGNAGTAGSTAIRLPNSVAMRSELLAWIKWETERAATRDAWRFWLTFGAAVAAAVLAFMAWRFPIPPAP